MAPTIEHIKTVNETAKDTTPPNPVGVFVGATSGIGEHTAYEFAKCSKSPVCYIVGRNESAGKQVVENLKQHNADPESKYYFLKSDVTLIKECDKLCEQIKQNESKINLLFLSSGFLTNRGRTESTEGLDTKLAVNYYGRWRIVQQLMPLLEAASTKDKGHARVVSVLSPGNEGPIEENDLDLKHNFSLSKANRHIVEFNSLAVVKFANEYPAISFTHAHPGLVNTGIMREFPWYIRNVMTPVLWFGNTPQKSAEKFTYVGWSCDEYAAGSHILDAGLSDIKEKPLQKGYLSTELQQKVWKHTVDKFNEIVKS